MKQLENLPEESRGRVAALKKNAGGGTIQSVNFSGGIHSPGELNGTGNGGIFLCCILKTKK